MNEKMNKYIKSSINYKLGFAFFIALLIPTLLVAAVSFFSAKQEIENKIHVSEVQSVATVGAFIDKHVTPIVSDINYLSTKFSFFSYLLHYLCFTLENLYRQARSYEAPKKAKSPIEMVPDPQDACGDTLPAGPEDSV